MNQESAGRMGADFVRLAAIVDSSDDAIIAKDLNSIITSWNKGAERVFGYTSSEMVGTSIMRLIPAGRQDEEARILESIKRGEHVGHFETVRQTKAGRLIHVSVTASPIVNDFGEVVGVSKVARDISKNKQVETRLKLLETCIGRLNDIVLITEAEPQDEPGPRILFVNDAFLRRTEYSREDVIGRSPRFLQGPKTSRAELDRVRGAMREWKPVRVELVNYTKSGAEFWIELEMVPVADETGWFTHWVAVERDITERKQTEEALRESEGRLRIVTENARIGLVMVNRDRRYTFANSTYAEILGLPLRNLVGLLVPDVLGSLYENEVRSRLDRAFAGERVAFEMRWPGGNGNRFYAVRYEPMVAGGTVSMVVVVLTDISERVKLDEARRASEARYRTLFDYSPDGIVIADSQSYYLDANPTACRLLGYSREELIGLHARDIVVEEEMPKIEPALSVIKSSADYRGEWRFRRKNGSLFLAEVIATVMPDGNLLGVIRDITDRRIAEERVQQSEARFRELAENINEVFWMIDPARHEMLYVSPAYEKIWGRSCESLYATPNGWLDAIHPEDRERVSQAAHDKQIAGNYDEEYRIIQPGNNSVRWIHDRAFPVRNAAGEVYRVAGTAEDITERKKIEAQFRQAQKMEGVGQLAGGIAHDFNNILAAINLQVELMKSSGELSKDQLVFADEIGVTVRRAASLTRQLLLFSRREVFQPRDLDLNESIGSTLKMLKRIVGENVQMHLHFAARPVFIHADAGMIDQVVMNLVVNARDAMPRGGQLEIETAAVDFDEAAASPPIQGRPGSFVRLSVKDSGCGIPAEILPRIFEPFFTTKDVGKGTGLGLATVFGIVQQHQGWVEVLSEAGRGTTFHVYFPRLSRSSNLIPAPAESAALRGGNETILLVEDDPTLRMMVRRILSQIGYRILEAPNGVKALDVWSKNRDEIRLLLTDMVMPEGMSGKDLADRLLQESPKLRVIYMSGYSAEVVGKDFPLKEGSNFLIKPFQAIKLAQTIREILDAPA